MIYPSKQDWLFSVKTFIAAMIALYLALYFQLPRPYWAMASVYVVSNPFVGATRSKSLYRACGTLLGAAAAVFFVPPLVDMPLVLSLVIALWTGTLLFVALNDRTASSYVFMLAGYTLPLIAFPTVFDPSTVFDVATARSEEIVLGIVCASVVNSTLLPNKLGPTLGERTMAWFNDASAYIRETMRGRVSGKDLSVLRQRLASSVNGLEFLLSQLAYDDVSSDVLSRAQSLRGRMSLLLPMASALGDPLAALRAHGSVPADLDALMVDITDWVGGKDGANRNVDADRLRARLDAMEPLQMSVPEGEANAPQTPLLAVPRDTEADADAAGDANVTRIAAEPYDNPQWDRALLSALLWRLRLVIDLWQDCRTLRDLIDTSAERRWVPQLRHWRLGGADRHIDVPMLLLSILPAVGATFCASAIWIYMGWADGASAATLAAVACSFFAAMDSPAPQVKAFLIWTAFSSVLAGVYLFAVLPNVHDFPMLVVMLAVPFIIAGSFIPQPRFTLATMLTAVNTATFLSIQGAYDANFLTFVNSNMAGCAGLMFALIVTLVTRPFGAEFAAARLTRAGWADVVIAASPHAIASQSNMAARMLDRLMQLLPRLAASEDTHHPSVDSFRDLRVGLNALDLQHVRRTLTEELRMPIDNVLAGIRQYFQQCIEHHARLAPPAELAARIDAALAADADANTDARGALHALVGLRLSLFPVAANVARPAP